MSFIYHPDNVIFRNGFFYKTYTDFTADNPDFPIIEGEFFELKDDGSFSIMFNFNGTYTHIPRNSIGYQPLINAINNLGD